MQYTIDFWKDHLQSAIPLPNGEFARITIDDLYHLMIDDRIMRKPERIEQIIRNTFEIRQAKEGRRRILSTWEESGWLLFGFAIIDSDNSIRTMHIINRRGLRKYQNQAVLWSQSELQAPGTVPQ